MHESPTLDLTLVVVGLLFAASLVAVVSRKIRFPFTILLVVLGLGLGWAAREVEFLHALTIFTLTPDVVFFVFLPVLIFESAFSLDARSLLKNLLPIVTLAVPGLLISTATVGFLMHLVLGLSLDVALLFGALISATDPVAVIALFKEMGAPKRLTLLVEGESLFNDGTALVLFKLLVGVVVAGHFSGETVLEGTLDFLVVFAGGVLVGVVLGLFFSQIIGGVENDPLVEVTLTTILAHSAFVTAEHFLHVSGVMATVAAGLTLGSYGRTKISPPIHHAMHTFWEYFAFVCNSLIFLLVGMSIDLTRFPEIYPAILWGAAFIILARALAVYLLFPLLGVFKRIEPVGRAYQTVVFWGGLRGALAIAMALSLPAEIEEKSFILPVVLGMVLFTLLVNGLTIKPLMRLLGLDRYSLKESYERSQTLLAAKREALQRLDDLARQGVIQRSLLESRGEGYEAEIEKLRKDLHGYVGQTALRLEDEAEIILRHCLMIERSEYGQLFEQGALHEDSLRELHHHIDVELDRIKEGRKPARLDEDVSIFGRIERTVHQLLGRVPLVKKFVRRVRTTRIASSYETVRARTIASGVVLKEIGKWRTQHTFSASALESAHSLYQGIHDGANAGMESLRANYPEFVEKVEASILERLCLTAELDTFETQYEHGAISDKVFSDMREHINTRIRKMTARPVKELLIPPVQLMKMVPCFNEFGEEDLVKLAAHLTAQSFLRGEVIVQQGDQGTSLFIIGRGEVEVIRRDDGQENHMADLKAGDFFGEIALLHPQPRTATVRATTPCTLLELSRSRLMPYLDQAPHLREILEEAYQMRITTTLGEQSL